MMDEYSTTPLTNALVGGLIALLTVTLPLFIVCDPIHFTNVEESVKINNIVNET